MELDIIEKSLFIYGGVHGFDGDRGDRRSEPQASGCVNNRELKFKRKNRKNC